MSLPALARVDRILLAILLLGAMLAVVLHWLLAPPEKTGDLLRQPSTFFNVGTGAKAAYEVLDELNYPVSRIRRRISAETLKGVGVLFVLRPNVGLAPEEVATLKEWVGEGHSLILVPGSPPRESMSHRSVSHDDSYLDNWFDTVNVPSTPAKEAADLFSGEHPVPLQKIESGDALTAGITELATPEGQRFNPKSPCREPLQDASVRVFWKDPQGTIGLAAELGDGTLIALVDDYPLTNLGISEGDNGLLLANMVREMTIRYPGSVAFDEFHLGLAEHDVAPVAIVKLMMFGSWRWAVVQAALVCVLALFAKAVRFGSPQGVVQKPRRQHREFAEAAGRLFDEAGATSLAAETLYHYYRERICKLLGFNPQVGDRELREALERRAGAGLAAELLQVQAALHGSLSRKRLLAVSRKLHRVVEALEHGS